MAWFSQSKPDKDTQLFLSEFPSWAAVHSAHIVEELQNEDKNGWASILEDGVLKMKLTNCLIAAHLLYLTLTPEGKITSTLFGENIIERSLSVLPDDAKRFYLLAFSFYLKDSELGEASIATTLGYFYKIKINPLDACIAFITDKEVNNSDEFSLLIGALLPTVNQLQREQLEWLKELVGKWSRLKK